MKKITLAIVAAPAAIPPKPNIAATIAIIRKITVQRNIVVNFKVINICKKFIKRAKQKIAMPINFTRTIALIEMMLNKEQSAQASVATKA